MPNAYPPGPPTLSGDLLTVSRFLQSPTAIRRRLRDYRDLRFVSDQLLTQRFVSAGGAVVYELSEPFVNDRPVEAVAPGAEYPMANQPTGTAGIAAVSKWGQKVRMTDEQIKRSVYQGQAVDRALQKTVNTVIQQVDGVTMSAIASTVTASVASATTTSSSGAGWADAAAKILFDILKARAAIKALNQGYKPDTLLINDMHEAYMMSDEVIVNALRRETTDNPIYTGTITTIAGLVIVVAPSSVAMNPYVLDSTQLGGMADETESAPGYAISDLAVEIKSLRLDDRDAWDLQGRRITVPVIQEPGSACEITGTGSF
jgi:hypothetical protein